MSTTYIPKKLRRLVEKRAGFRCEYCLLPMGMSFFPFGCDHIIAEIHGGETTAANLAFCCPRCNSRKGTNFASFDPASGAFCFLFNPRTQVWTEHFTTENEIIIPLTPEGRATVQVLQLNIAERLAERRKMRGRI